MRLQTEGSLDGSLDLGTAELMATATSDVTVRSATTLPELPELGLVEPASATQAKRWEKKSV